MIHSSGQIFTGRAAELIEEGITTAKDNEGYYRTAFKAICIAESPDGTDTGVYGPWVKEAGVNDESTFVGIIGDDVAPYANREVLDDREPVLGYGKSRSFAVGDVLTIERNGILSVVAGDDITQGAYLKLAANGTFQEGDKDDGIGFAMESAKSGERFRATIYAL
jgi:hypothetical protein